MKYSGPRDDLNLGSETSRVLLLPLVLADTKSNWLTLSAHSAEVLLPAKKLQRVPARILHAEIEVSQSSFFNYLFFLFPYLLLSFCE